MKPWRCISCSARVKQPREEDPIPGDTKWMSIALPGKATSANYRPCLCNLCRAELPQAVLAMFEHYSRMIVHAGISFERVGELFSYHAGEEGGDEPCESITQREGEPPTDKPNQSGSNSEQREGGSNAPT